MLDFFPSRTLAWHMAKMYLVRSIAVMVVLIMVLQVLDLLGESDNILSVPGNGQAQLLTYVSLRIPQLIQRFAPFCFLLGALVTLATLNQNSEVIAMKAAGLSAHQVLAPLILASVGVAGLTFAFNERIVPRAAATLNRWQAVNYGKPPSGNEGQVNVWVRDEDDLIHAAVVTGRGNAVRLQDVHIYDRQGGQLLRTIEAAHGHYDKGALILHDTRTFDVASGKVIKAPDLRFGFALRPDQFTLSNIDPAGLSFMGLRQATSDLEAAGRPSVPQRAALWHKLSGPLSTILMPLLAAVAGFGLARTGQLFVRAVIGMALGFAYFVADNFGLAMGNLGAYPAWLAAWGPFVLFLLIGEAVLIRSEE
ncbi:MAG TPA: LPS export ABC transporter permease LptG [Sphingomonas sp.]|jgi:lipopolysaccharide export system permease protein|nr:LPS export ABC transporter permease LptG [Sphingomonas sp.]